MKINYGKCTGEYGSGVQIELTGDEVARAIYSYLVAHNIHIRGAATVRVNGNLCEDGGVYVDPSGYVVANGKTWNGSRHVSGSF